MAMTLDNIKYRLQLFKESWKLVIHLLFSTYHFGVNNDTWVRWRSMFGRPILTRFWLPTIISNYRLMKFRMNIGFLPKDKVVRLGWWKCYEDKNIKFLNKRLKKMEKKK